jgi:hypothetical protein
MIQLTPEQADTLTTCADGVTRVCEEMHWTLAQLQEAALNSNIEQCPGCRWWCESIELIPYDSDDPDGFCTNCRQNET